jgi:Sec-independent protein translocase protein TatA
MEVFGIGPLELLLIFFLALILLGPKDMVNSAKKLANWIRGFRESDIWKSTKEISQMPKKIMKETGLEDELSQMRHLSNQTMNDVINEVSQSDTDPKREPPLTPRKPTKKSTKTKVTAKRKPKSKG